MIPIRGLRAPVSATPRHDELRAPKNAHWPAERERLLAELWNAEQPVSKIADRLGISRNAVTGKAARIGLPRRPNPVPRGGSVGFGDGCE